MAPQGEMELAIKVGVISAGCLIEVLLQNKAQRSKILDAIIHQPCNGCLQSWR
jgi:hypothetical protein